MRFFVYICVLSESEKTQSEDRERRTWILLYIAASWTSAICRVMFLREDKARMSRLKRFVLNSCTQPLVGMAMSEAVIQEHNRAMKSGSYTVSSS